MKAIVKQLGVFFAISLLSLIVAVFLCNIFNIPVVYTRVLFSWLYFVVTGLAATLLTMHVAVTDNKTGGYMVYGIVLGKFLLNIVFFALLATLITPVDAELLVISAYFYLIYSTYYIRFAVKTLNLEEQKKIKKQ